MLRLSSLSLLLVTGCLITQEDHEAWLDQDGDGVLRDEDCDDLDALIGTGQSWHLDEDGDGFAAEGAGTLEACEQPSGTSELLGDCDDGDASVYPGADDEWYDGVDSNCDGAPDYDQDGDGYDIEDEGLDCDDTDPDINPEAFEVVDGVDNDCDHDVDFIDLVESGAVLVGEEDGDQTGQSVAGLGDVNGDGVDDVLVGSNRPANEKVYGKAFLALGPLSGEVDLATDTLRIDGTMTRDKVGYKVASAGDVNGDLFADFLVGGHKGGDPSGWTPGEAYLFLGHTSMASVLVDEADVVFQGVNHDDQLGYDMADAGDLDGDGLSDLALTAVSYANQRGKVYVALGVNTTTGTVSVDDLDFGITGEAADDRSGRGVAMGDLTGDGFDELLIGAKEQDGGGPNAGAVYLFDFDGDPQDRDITDADNVIAGAGSGDVAGGSLDVADVDGDGLGDLLVGAERVEDGDGAAYLVSAGNAFDLSSLDKATASVAGDESCGLGRSVVALGDVNGDGQQDVAFGGPGCSVNGQGSGGVFVMLNGLDGALTLDDASFVLAGEGSGHAAGWSVGAAGDIDADGLPDILVGAYDEGGGPGKAYLFYGGDY